MTFHRTTALAVLLAAAVALSACGNKDGAADRTGGQIKETAGSLTGNDKLKHEGQKDKVVGDVKGVVGDVKDAVKH